MVRSNPNNGDTHPTQPNLHSPPTHRLSEDIDSSCSTPYVSAPSSPGRGPSGPSGYFFSAPASPMHFILSTTSELALSSTEPLTSSGSGSFDFEFSSRISLNGPTGNGSMSSADELFFNGQIRPMKLSSHLKKPQILAPLLDLEVEDEDSESESVTRGRDVRLRSRSLHKKSRSMSPLRSGEFQWREEREVPELEDCETNKQSETTPSGSASSSRSSSSGRNSKKWIFLKDLLYRSKSEGRENNKDKFWSSISFSPSKEKKLSDMEAQKQTRSKQVTANAKKSVGGKPANGVSKRRVPQSPHELHYTTNRAQAEEMKKKTFLPYRQGLLGCLGFSSKGYGAFNGLTRTLNPVSSR